MFRNFYLYFFEAIKLYLEILLSLRDKLLEILAFFPDIFGKQSD